MASKTIADLFADDLIEQITERVLARLAVSQPAVTGPQVDTLRLDEAADLVRLSERELRRQVASGRLRSIKVGRARLIPRSALAEFLESFGSS